MAASKVKKPESDGQARAVAFFFFDSNEGRRQSVTNMLPSLLTQLLSGEPLEVIKHRHDALLGVGVALSETTCFKQLQQAIRTKSITKAVYILVDAIDESDDMASAFSQLSKLQHVHVMMTCQDPASDELPVGLTTISVDLSPETANADIRSYVVTCLAEDTRLKRFLDAEKRIILDQLLSACDGM